MIKRARRSININKVTSKEPLSERVYKEIKKAILEGQFGPGELLPEDFLTDATGASRTPVRAALMRLQGDGLVEIMPRRGAKIINMDDNELAELIEVRALVETVWLERTINNISQSWIDDIRQAMDTLVSQMELITPNSVEWTQRRIEYLKIDFSFHRGLVEAAGNRFLLKLYDEIQELSTLYSHVFIIKYPQSFFQSVQEHRELLTALSNKDVAEARQIIWSHLNILVERMAKTSNE